MKTMGTCSSLVGLLGHDNIDIILSVVDVLGEFLDDDALQERLSDENDDHAFNRNTKELMQLVDAFVSEYILPRKLRRLVSNSA